MSALVERKVEVVEDARWKFQLGERTVEMKTQVDRIVKAILFAKDFVSSAVSAEPHAALAWAGVCMLLPLSLNPEIQKQALVEGLDYVSSLIVRFTTIEQLYHQQDPRPRSLLDKENLEELNRSFEAQLTKLYSQVLTYQAQVVCQMCRRTFIRSGRDILKLDDWSTSLEDIKKAEAACTGISQVVGWEKLEATLEDVSRKLDLSLHEHSKQYYDLQDTADHILMAVEHFSKEQQQWRRTDEESRCLQALCTLTYEDYKDRNPARVPGTCLWFLKNQEFSDWLESRSSDLLWVTADPNCGKSVLSRSRIDYELQSGPSRTTCYFFFKDLAEQRSATNPICALLHQLCTQNQSVLQQIVRVYQSNGNQLTLPFSWLWKTFPAATSRPEAGEIICVLDALDECEEQDKITLIETLNNFYTARSDIAGRNKFLVTSRPYYDIEDRFDELVIRVTGEEESEQIGKEIDLVIKDKVPKITARKKFDRKTQDALQERLLATESRTYLWLYLALADIEKAFGITNPKKMRQFVDRIPKSVDEAYEAMLNRSPDSNQARKLLHIVLAAVRPLDLREVNMAFNLEQGHKSYEDVDLIPEISLQSHVKNVCGLMLTIHDSCIYLLHQTLKEFLVASSHPGSNERLVSTKEAWKHMMESSESNRILAKICMTYLMFSIFESDLESDPLPHGEQAWFADATYTSYIGKHYFLSYAAKNWSTHFKLAKGTHELSLTWYDICNTKSSRFKSWLYASYSNWYVEGADSFDVACFLGHNTIVKQLLRPDTDLEKHHATDEGTVLASAAKRGYHAVVDTLISYGASINTETTWGQTPLHWAVESGIETVLSSLLQGGAYVDAKGYQSQTPLHMAAWKGYEALAKKFLCNGASLDTTNRQGQTPLFSAIHASNVNIANMMLDKGASVDVRDNDGLTPLSYAAWTSNGRMVKFLLQKAQHTGFSDLISNNCAPDSEHMEELMVNILFTEVSSPDFKISEHMTLLHWAVINGLDKSVQKSLEKGASVDIKTNQGETALALAAFYGHAKIVRILLDNGALTNSRDNSGGTPLHDAAAWHEEITQMLLDAGADPNAIDRFDLKPLDCAKECENQVVVGLLEPLTNDNHERPPRDHEFETNNLVPEGNPSHESGEQAEAIDHAYLTWPFHQKIQDRLNMDEQ